MMIHAKSSDKVIEQITTHYYKLPLKAPHHPYGCCGMQYILLHITTEGSSVDIVSNIPHCLGSRSLL
jgi:hypothetical protein